MHAFRIQRVRLMLAIVGSFGFLSAPALADERPWEQARWNALEVRPLAAGIELAPESRWALFSSDADVTRDSDRDGRLTLHLGRNFAVSIQAPPVEEWAPGLAFELRF